MLVLGIGGFLHDYNCCLIDLKEKRVAMCEAERLSRRKHHVIRKGDDLLAPVRKCCDDLGCKPRHIDTVVFGHTDHFDAKDWMKKELGGKRFVDVDHHLSHAAAFFSSPYESALVVSMDGFGDGSSGILAVGSGNRLEEIERISQEHSIGLEYLRATVHLGLGGYGSEGKTQGLAPYGEPRVFDAYMKEIEITSMGNVILSARLRNEDSRLAEEGGYLNTQLLNNAFLNAYCPRRIAPEPLVGVHNDLAASIQKVLEHTISEICLIGARRTGKKDLVLCGGVAMNSSLNGRILTSGAFERIFAFPLAADRGTGLGAALYHVHHELGVPRFFRLRHTYYGGAFEEKRAVKAMKKAGLRFKKESHIVDTAARALAEGKIVGWFQGASEVGARALGNRSILADPRSADMKDRINVKVKHRELFRPFAPAVLEDRARDYFSYRSGVTDLSHMTFTVESTKRGVEAAPAVVHVDGTARIQTVNGKDNEKYAALIKRFADITGVPVLLNTSFNDSGEPIVETPEDAVATFMRTDMDMLCIGDVVAEKQAGNA